MKISDYIPNLYNNNTEFLSIIYSEQEELESKLKIALKNIFKDTFAKIATINGIENWEKLLNIILDDNSDNIEYRRNRVLTRLSTTTSLTYKWLEESLNNLLGENNFNISLDGANYTITINVANLLNDTAESIYDLYRPLIPANLVMTVNLIENETTNLYFGVIIHEGETIKLQSEVI